ncbi:hypothetical protein CMUS01_12455 [Colletotrichum musicola]|uniref:Uncharacterized protein n=1 Tax=Colletotrichum musicola TaxID=2175873 RepID=A0A8H6JMQ7_9PEZI|nr:hypothetical protein CMUS01_12455 [Colletotrichum musicola]
MSCLGPYYDEPQAVEAQVKQNAGDKCWRRKMSVSHGESPGASMRETRAEPSTGLRTLHSGASPVAASGQVRSGLRICRVSSVRLAGWRQTGRLARIRGGRASVENQELGSSTAWDEEDGTLRNAGPRTEGTFWVPWVFAWRNAVDMAQGNREKEEREFEIANSRATRRESEGEGNKK